MSRPDVCLVLEGTFPYVRGGVSGWVDQLINALPHLSFAIFFIGSDRKSTQTRYYDIPKNVVDFQTAYLFERPPASEFAAVRLSPGVQKELRTNLEAIYFAEDRLEQMIAVQSMATWLEGDGQEVRFGNLLHDHTSWTLLRRYYEQKCPEVSFIDFFWNCRFLHQPLWQMMKSVSLVPDAAVYHCISTGYAGALGALASHRRNAPCFLTEHGIYTKERMIEVVQADWIHEPPGHGILSGQSRLALKNLWIEMFAFLGAMTYRASNPIISLYSGNARLQEEFGADPSTQEIIPNGIFPDRFQSARDQLAKRPESSPCRVGFVGRIVPIKDIKTLLRASRMAADVVPDILISLHGPASEDETYSQECHDMVESLGLVDNVRFAGPGKIEEILAGEDLVVLTSISEALPLVILEAFACGTPVVATDVGACRELLNGRTPEDKALGRAGILTEIASPSKTAEAIVRLARDESLRRKMGQAGLARVKRFYDQKLVMERYDTIYQELRLQKGTPWQE